MAIKAKTSFPEKKVLIGLSVPPLFGSYRADLFEKGRDQADEYYRFFLKAASPYFK